MANSQQEKNYNDFVAEWKGYEQEVKNAAKNNPHTLAEAKKYAFLDRQGQMHTRNGFYYIKGRGRCAIYDTPTWTPAGQGPHLYVFDYTRPRGGTNFLSASKPYKNEAHHMLPVKAFGKKYFTRTQLALLKKLPYNINHGENIIFLPKKERFCKIHNLPKHSGKHTPYNAAVAADAKILASKMTEQAQDPCDPAKPIQLSILKDMIKLESQYWKILAAAGALTTVRKVGQQLLDSKRK